MTTGFSSKCFGGFVGIAVATAWSVSCGSPAKLGDPGPTGVGGSVNIGLGGTGGSVDPGLGGSGPGPVNISLGGAAGTASFGGAAGTQVPSSSAGTCGTTTTDTTRAGADVLIVLDRTESMNWSLTADSDCRSNDPACSSRLAAVVPAVGQVVTDHPEIQWGLELFRSPDARQSCVVSPDPQVTIGPDSAAAIKEQLANLTTASSTPTAAAITVATNYLKTVNDNNNKAILLATDGQPNCANGTSGADDMAGATAAVTAANAAGFPVYVVGIGPSVSNLNALAQAGGTDAYYPATSPEALGAALSSIAKVVSATCTFKANATPPDKELVYVYVDKQLVTKNASDGWVFAVSDPTSSTIELTGATCEKMLAGQSTRVEIVFGCPNVPPPPFIP